jgi:hypothetical protein
LMLTVMAVGIITTSIGVGADDDCVPLEGDADVEEPGDAAEVGAGWWVRKAPRSSTIRMPRPASAVTAIEAIRPAVVEMRGCQRLGPSGWHRRTIRLRGKIRTAKRAGA